MRLLIDASTATAALTANAPVAKISDLSGADGCAEQSRGIFIFAGTDAADETINYQVTGYFELQNGVSGEAATFLPIPIAAGVATLGTLTVGAAGLGFATAASLIADTVTETLTSIRATPMSPADNTVAYLEVDLSGLVAIQIETDLGTAAAASVAFQPDDSHVMP